MKAKISKLNPVGDVEESRDFYIPLINKSKIKWIKLENGIKVKDEPMKQSRYLLEIGEFKYLLARNGELFLIENKNNF